MGAMEGLDFLHSPKIAIFSRNRNPSSNLFEYN